MILTLKRTGPVGEATMGTLALDGAAFCDTLERTGVMIPPGRYRVYLTTSERVRHGTLWSPRPDGVLPLVDQVPERSGIRFHALNRAEQSDGCIGVGVIREELPGEIHGSRATLTTFLKRLTGAGTVWLDVVDA